jgi:hypothetical protein
MARPPFAAISETTLSAWEELPAWCTTTLKPSDARRRATALPMPPDAPVISATPGAFVLMSASTRIAAQVVRQR